MVQKQRNSSIELLRVISLIGVVILHYNNASIGNAFGLVTQDSINQKYLFFSESCSICAVNLFIIISAYFLSQSQKRRFSKIVELLFQVVVFNAAIYLFDAIQNNSFSIGQFFLSSLPTRYFVILYSVLYIISPYINLIIQKLNRKQFSKFLIVLFVLFSVCTILVDYFTSYFGDDYSALSTIGLEGSQAGYTIVNFALSYLIGAYVRKYDISLSKIKSLSIFLISVCLIFIGSVFEQIFNLNHISWNYNSPLVFMAAVSIFLLFKDLMFNSKVINEIAQGAFTCYIIHSILLRYIHIDEYVNENVFLLIIHQLGSAVLIYVVSYLIYKLYYFCTFWFFKLINPYLNKVNISLDI